MLRLSYHGWSWMAAFSFSYLSSSHSSTVVDIAVLGCPVCWPFSMAAGVELQVMLRRSRFGTQFFRTAVQVDLSWEFFGVDLPELVRKRQHAGDQCVSIRCAGVHRPRERLSADVGGRSESSHPALMASTVLAAGRGDWGRSAASSRPR